MYKDDPITPNSTPTSMIYIKGINSAIINKNEFKLNGIGTIRYHLSCDFFRDEDGTLCFSPRIYIEKIIEGYIKIFSKKHNHNVTPPHLKKGQSRAR